MLGFADGGMLSSTLIVMKELLFERTTGSPQIGGRDEQV
jgi:hypothetical protein